VRAPLRSVLYSQYDLGYVQRPRRCLSSGHRFHPPLDTDCIRNSEDHTRGRRVSRGRLLGTPVADGKLDTVESQSAFRSARVASAYENE